MTWTAAQRKRRYTVVELWPDGVTEEPPIKNATLPDMFPDGPEYAYPEVLDMRVGQVVFTGGGAAGEFRVTRTK